MSQDKHPLSPSKSRATSPTECYTQPVEGANTFELEQLSEDRENKPFYHFFPGLETFPIAASEVATILGQPQSQIAFYQKRGIVSRSVENEWRRDLNFSFFNFFDLYRLAIIQRLYLLSFCGHEDFENLMDELMDEIYLEADQALCDRRFPKVSGIRRNLIFWFSSRAVVWKKFWLLDGELFEPVTAADISLWTWIKTFEEAGRKIRGFGP